LKLCPLPCSLSDGYPDNYIKSDQKSPAGVEVVLKALQEANVPWQQYSVITFRNNLNKICNTLLDARQPWRVDGCILSGYPNTAFLDIQVNPVRFTILGVEHSTEFGRKGIRQLRQILLLREEIRNLVHQRKRRRHCGRND